MTPISAVLVTRGDVDLEPVLESLRYAFDDIVVWNNADRPVDRGVLGRYLAVNEAKHEYVYVQDDDCVLPPESLDALIQAAFAPRWSAEFGWGGTAPEFEWAPPALVANMPERFRPHYDDSCLIGFGAIFHRLLPTLAFSRIDRGRLADPEWFARFQRTCDVYFTALTRRRLVDVPYTDLPHAYADNRMWKQPQHVPERAVALDDARWLCKLS